MFGGERLYGVGERDAHPGTRNVRHRGVHHLEPEFRRGWNTLASIVNKAIDNTPRSVDIGASPISRSRIPPAQLQRRAMRTLLLSLVPSLALAQAQPVPQTTAKPGWRWTIDSVFTVVNSVRAGRSLQPAAWPNGARVAVLLSFDVDNETIALRFGEPNAGTLSQGQYGSRQGLRRVVELLDRNRIPASFFIPSVSLQIAPEMANVIQELSARGLSEKLKVLVGGAPVSGEFAEKIGADGYGADAAEAVRLARRFLGESA